LSQHIGDFENYETLQFFEETLENLKKLFRVEPQAVAYDLHPRYMSSRFAQTLPVDRKIGVQHHHAHIASCMAENHLKGRVIGVAFDGTGYGTDGQIWGGEFLIADFTSFKRHAHLRYVPLPGGDAAVRQPWRVALSCLRDTFGSGKLPDAAFLKQVPEKQVALVDAMLSRGINSIQTSSCGRLFDTVASLIGLRNEVNFEGQAAIELEAIASRDVTQEYPFRIVNGDPAQIDFRPMIEALVEGLARSNSQSYISACFHNTLARVIVEMCRRIREEEDLNRVCLSGGTFQNHYLLDRAVIWLREIGFETFIQSTVPSNDGGISLGQAVIANETLRNGDPHVLGNSR
jgi:hydrogenase maturation protein HypF